MSFLHEWSWVSFIDGAAAVLVLDLLISKVLPKSKRLW